MKPDVYIAPPTRPRVQPRPALIIFGRPRRAPAPTLLGWALGIVLVLLVAGVGLAIARAEEEEIPRYQPSGRGNRAAQLERSEVVDLAAEVFGAELAPYVAAIAWCESRHRPGARNAGWDRVFGWYEYLGLLQIERGIWSPLASALTGSDDLTDPYVNLVTGRAIQRQQGWGAWPVCSR